jgi:7-cyano-7-deazaguanine synthase
MAKKTIVVFSGGLDSTVLLAALLAEGRECKALSVDYGQRHRRELVAADKICHKLRVDHKVANLNGLRPLLVGSSQTDTTVPVPHGHYEEESMKKTVVPNRNMLLLATAGAWAIGLKYDSIAYAAHAGDHAVYPDCREEFVVPLREALRRADWHEVDLERPFIHKTKAEVVRLGHELKAPLALSWSCYEGRPRHCGKCGTCVERREAFQVAGVEDPTVYAP